MSDVTATEVLSLDTIQFAGDASPDEVRSWVSKAEQGLDTQAIEEHLLPRTFVVGHELSAADFAFFTSYAPRIIAASHQERLKTPATTRHFDLVQHQSPLIQALTRLGSTLAVPTPIDVDNVPKVDTSAQMLVKKKKDKKPVEGEDAATAPAPVAAAVAEAPAKAAKKAKGEDKSAKAAKGGAAAPPAAASADSKAKPSMIDLRVGRIVDVKKHPDADSLYVEQIDIGEAEPRTVVSGLVKYVPIEQMQGRLLIAVCNLKPASMRGVKSFAMVLCASAKEGKGEPGSVEICDPPEGSQPGDRVYFEGLESDTPLDQLNPKKKIFETIQPGFLTLDSRECVWRDPESGTERKIVTSKGVVKSPSLVGASLS